MYTHTHRDDSNTPTLLWLTVKCANCSSPNRVETSERSLKRYKLDASPRDEVGRPSLRFESIFPDEMRTHYYWRSVNKDQRVVAQRHNRVKLLSSFSRTASLLISFARSLWNSSPSLLSHTWQQSCVTWITYGKGGGGGNERSTQSTNVPRYRGWRGQICPGWTCTQVALAKHFIFHGAHAPSVSPKSATTNDECVSSRPL